MLHKILAPLILSAVLTGGCSHLFQPPVAAPPQLAARTMSQKLLAGLPRASENIMVSLYDFQDQTGQFAPNDTYASYSKAVTQGGLAILTKALLDTSDQRWFTVIDRYSLKDVKQERDIINQMHTLYAGPDGKPLGQIQPMMYAGLLIEGGITSYESNVVTGGGGAKYLGIGADSQYRRDIVTVYLRLVNSQTGQVLLSVNTSKTIYSTAVDISVFRYVAFDKLLEMESGFTANEPPQFAVRQAIEMAVYSLVMEGSMKHIWSFADADAGNKAIHDYLIRRDGSAPPIPPTAAPAAPVVTAPEPVPAPAGTDPQAQPAQTTSKMLPGVKAIPPTPSSAAVAVPANSSSDFLPPSDGNATLPDSRYIFRYLHPSGN